MVVFLFNPLNAELNPIYHLLALLGSHHILHVSRIRVNTVIYVFLLLCLCILIVCLCVFIVPTGTLRLPRLRFLRAFSSVVRHMPGYKPPRRGTARTVPNCLCRSVYCLCVNVYCIIATGWLPNYS